jgi:hypothetical protein
MRLAICTLCVAFAVTAPLGAAVVPTDPDARILRLERWLKATLAHQPGTKDDAVVEVSLWSDAELRMLFVDEGAIAQLILDPDKTRAKVPDAGGRQRPPPYTPWQLHRLRVLGCAAGGDLTVRPCVDQAAESEIDLDPTLSRLAKTVKRATERGEGQFVLRRGALLHGDIAMSGPAPVMAPDTSGGGGRIRVQVADGESTGFTSAPIHWEMARGLFDNVKPVPGDTLARDWYVATAAWMQAREQHDTLHLKHAREMFPDDPAIAFFSGCQQETYASAAIQAVLRSAVLPQGFTIDVPPEAPALRDAETYFRRTLAKEPTHVEARMHLGHVLLARRRAQEAAVELRQLPLQSDEPGLQYFSAMFLGLAEEGVGRFDEARAAYERASAISAGAQSPYLALGALATRRGDRRAALAQTQKVFDLPAMVRQPSDPWWEYRTLQARKAEAMLGLMYASVVEAGR